MTHPLAARITAAGKRRQRPEELVQKACAEWLTLCVPPPPDGPSWFHVPNQRGTRKRFEMGILKAMGVKPGVPDFILCWRSLFYAVEVKAPKGRPSDGQDERQEELRAAGAQIAEARSVDDLRAILRAWGMPTREVGVEWR